ncbi:MAG: hypothetical protein U0840_09240 [Gemmataceae bacterium]
MAGVIMLLLIPGAMELPPQQQGGIRAQAVLSIPEEGVEPGRARARLELEFTGPAGLEVDRPQLEDALQAWRMPWLASSSTSESPLRVVLTLELEQTRPGTIPLPGVRVRAREGPDQSWQTFDWLDLLRQDADVAPIEELPEPEPSPWPGRVRLAAVGVLLALGLMLLLRRFNRARPASPPTPISLARTKLQQAQHVGDLADIVRECIRMQTGIAVTSLTSGDLLAALSKIGHARDTLESLQQLLELGDLGKFAGQRLEGAALEETRALALDIVASLASWPSGEKDPTGEER